jgi:transcriptional regulator with GAF, ATPase, and Fis domain
VSVLRDIQQVADTEATVLILGETGTGKEVMARAIHTNSLRRDHPFIKVNCAAIPATLIESEFFGHEQGAFTGATKKREGRFSLADGGTIFLDEIGELPFDLQGKLLRVLQEGEFEPVGSSRTQHVNVRVLAATNRDLQKEVQEGKFREDLYYRLNVFPIHLPPLRERGEDVLLLANTFVQHFAQRMGRAVAPLSADALRRLTAYHWPGNVRELQNVMERAVITAKNGQLNLDRAIPDVEEKSTSPPEIFQQQSSPCIRTTQELQDFERQNILLALKQTGWKVSGETGAAKLLGMNSSTLASRIKALGITRKSQDIS